MRAWYTRLSGDDADRIAASLEDDVYLSTPARYIAALGGHLEVRAVFADERITVFREPGRE